MAKCILDNPTGACAIYAPREGGTTLPPEYQTFQQCQIDAAKVPDPDEEPEPDAGSKLFAAPASRDHFFIARI